MKLKITLLVLIIVLLTPTLTGCFSCNSMNLASKYESGQRIDLTLDNFHEFITLKAKNLEATKKSGLYTGIAFKYISDGLSEFSYFNVEIIVEVTTEALTDAGTYKEIVFTQVMFLDEAGEAEVRDTYKFGTSFRNLKELSWRVVKITGYVVKK